MTDYTEKPREKDFFHAIGWSQKAFVEKKRIVLINRAGSMEFLNLNQTPSTNKIFPSYLTKAYKELSQFSKKPTTSEKK